MSERLGAIDVDLSGSTCRARYDFEATAPSTAVVDLLRTVTDEEWVELEPLYEFVDPEALDGVFDEGSTRNRRGRRTVTFSYRDFSVTVRSDGVVAARPRSDDERCGETRRDDDRPSDESEP